MVIDGPLARGPICHDLGVDPKLSDLARLRRVRDRIDREYAQPLDVEALARGAHMSAGHLSRQFRLAYGEPPYSYLMTRRIERAMTLLRQTDRPVTDIAWDVGFASLGTFSRTFSNVVGLSPTEFRARHVPVAVPSCFIAAWTRPREKGDSGFGEAREGRR